MDNGSIIIAKSPKKPAFNTNAVLFLIICILIAAGAVYLMVHRAPDAQKPSVAVNPVEQKVAKKEPAGQVQPVGSEPGSHAPEQANAPAESGRIPADGPAKAAPDANIVTIKFILNQGFLAQTNIPADKRHCVPASAQIGIYYPPGFPEEKDYPVFVALQSGEGDFIPGMLAYRRFADEFDFIITAQNLDAKTDQEAYGRYYYILASIAYFKNKGIIGRQPVWIGGDSGGANWAMRLAAYGGNTFAAVLAIGAKDDFSSVGYKELPNTSAKNVLIYLLNGSRDSSAGPENEQYKKMLVSLRENGFWNVTAKIFEGGHEIPYAETTRAFELFIKNRQY